VADEHPPERRARRAWVTIAIVMGGSAAAATVMAGTILRGRGSGVRDVGVHLNAGDRALDAVPAGEHRS
jgi:hypothetical protein